MIFLKLEYNSPDLCLAYETIEVYSNWNTAELYSHVSKSIRLSEEHFKLSQRKDGFNVRHINYCRNE